MGGTPTTFYVVGLLALVAAPPPTTTTQKSDTWAPRNASSSLPQTLVRLLDEWPAKQAVAHLEGRFVTVIADRRGLGNRMGPIAGSLALALVTGRALAIQWPRRRCAEHKRSICDPTGLDDLFEPPPGVVWKAKTDCTKGPWVVHGDSAKTIDSLRKSKGLSHGEDWRAHFPNVCVDTDRCPVWGVTCNNEVADLFPPTPWLTYGALLEYLFRKPTPAIQRRVDKAMTTTTEASNYRCGLGVHLRKQKYRRGWATRTKVTANGTFVRAYDVIANFMKHDDPWERPTFLESSPTSSSDDDDAKKLAVYIAADEYSQRTKDVITQDLVEAGIPVIEAITTDPSRKTFAGMYDAAAENHVLATCLDLLPRGVGVSTFHDMALARSIFRNAWSQDRIWRFVHFRDYKEEEKHAVVPSDCP